MTEKPMTGAVFAGGLALAAYHVGVVEALREAGAAPNWLAGSSAGAVTAALVAGGEADAALGRLEAFWGIPGRRTPRGEDPWAHLRGWSHVALSHLMGNGRHFHPRLPALGGFTSLYDLAEMRRRLAALIDFGRLNDGPLRLSIVATELASGDPVWFHSGADRITMDHLLASCGFLPEFAPVAIAGQVLVDGGLSLNAPFDAMLAWDGPVTLYIADLFARDGDMPTSLERALERKTDLIFANQTFLRLKLQMELRALKHAAAAPHDRVAYLSYRSGPAEPGSEKSFNFAADALARRWREGFLDMQAALAWPDTAGLRIVRR